MRIFQTQCTSQTLTCASTTVRFPSWSSTCSCGQPCILLLRMQLVSDSASLWVWVKLPPSILHVITPRLWTSDLDFFQQLQHVSLIDSLSGHCTLLCLCI
jgi:hypothetical protein